MNFTFIALPDPRLTDDLKARFLNVSQLLKWELTDSSGSYSGLLVVGEKAHPQGFQSMADITFDLGAIEVPMLKIQQVSQIVQTEFAQRAVITTTKPAKS